MRFVYGKQNWATMERGQENCYLLTNGLGGFSSGTMIGSSARSEHALLMACVEPPDRRLNMVHRMEERLVLPGETIHLSSQEYVSGGQKEEGYRFLSSFCFEDYPKWVFHASGVEVVKRVAMKQGENLVAVKYEIDNCTDGRVTLDVTPYLQFAPKGTGVERGQEFVLGENSVASNGHTLYFHTDGEVRGFPQQFVEGLFYAYDACDGRAREGNAYTNHRIIKGVPGHSCATLAILYSMDKKDWERQEGCEAWKGQCKRGEDCEAGKATASRIADKVIQEAVFYRNELVHISGMRHEAARMLVKSANQFVAERKSTGGKTILAGFPFFGDWGRDTMVAAAGCCITAGQLGTAKSILRTFAAYCKDGLMPNLFPEGHTQPQYNTADASLLYINAVYLYFKKTRDIPFLEEIWPVMKEIVKYYREGTAYGIHMDQDGLLLAGEGLSQVTWMDVRIGEILPTPRHGKPVEINAYWYNALCVMHEFGKLLKAETDYDYAHMADMAKKSFREKFWNREKRCLKDVVSGTDADGQIRCNQIWAVSMPFAMLDAAQEKQVVDTVFEKLYTPYGLRTLEKTDREFRGRYGGEQVERDLAYHQGTVWVFPLGAYYLAYLKTRGYSRKALETVSRQLEVLESAMAEGCIGQLPEIYDGENPSFSRGCFAQAWSVGEILRVYGVLEESGTLLYG